MNAGEDNNEEVSILNYLIQILSDDLTFKI